VGIGIPEEVGAEIAKGAVGCHRLVLGGDGAIFDRVEGERAEAGEHQREVDVDLVNGGIEARDAALFEEDMAALVREDRAEDGAVGAVLDGDFDEPVAALALEMGPVCATAAPLHDATGFFELQPRIAGVQLRRISVTNVHQEV